MSAHLLAATLAIVGLACTSPRRGNPSRKGPTSMPIKIRAHLRSVAPDRLQVSYEVANDGDHTVWLLDDILAFSGNGFMRAPASIGVREDDDPSTVKLARGVLTPEADVAFLLVPGARRLDPGRALSGEAETEVPLRAQTPQDKPRPLAGARTRAVVEIGILDDSDPPLSATQLEGGGEAQMPPTGYAESRQRIVRSDPVELPR